MTSTGGLGGDYPVSWDDFVGQDQAKRVLRSKCVSARMRGEALDHTLLESGIGGIGKTSLALLAANEMGGELKVISGKIPANEARIALAGLSDGDVLFYDEIHHAAMGGKANAEWLLHLLQDGVIMGPLGPEKQPKITVIGATTEAGKLPEPLLQRFGIRPVLVEYTAEEAALITVGLAKRVFPSDLPLPDEANCYAVAEAADRNPRLMRDILKNVRDIALVDEMGNYDREHACYDLTEALQWLGLTPDGLNSLARRYLVMLLTQFAGGAGERALIDALQEQGGLTYVERVLMRKGYLAKTKAGRILTGDGIKRAQELLALKEAA